MISAARYILLLMLANTCLYISSFCQNKTPVIKNARVQVNTQKREVTLTYDLQDMENDKIKITFRAFMGEKKYTKITQNSITGDIGFPVTPGLHKKIVWNYADTIKNIRDFKIRLIADDLYKIDAQEIVDKVSVPVIAQEIATIYGTRSHTIGKSLDHLNEVRKNITNDFKRGGLNVFQQRAMVGKADIQNVIGELEGVYEDAPYYILCAHYDTENVSPGADDNGSGITGVVEAVRVLAGYKFKKSIRFIGMDAEEIGHLGSIIYVKQAKSDPSKKIEGVINFDMIGFYSDKPNSQQIPFGYEQLYPDAVKAVLKDDSRGNFVLNTADKDSKALSEQYETNAHKYVPSLRVVSLVALGDWRFTPELNASDHFQFWKEGYRALHIGDTGPNRNKRLDTREDVMKTINLHFLANVVKATVATLASMAELQHCSDTIIAIPSL